MQVLRGGHTMGSTCHVRCGGCGRPFVVDRGELQAGDRVRCPRCRRVERTRDADVLERRAATGVTVRYGLDLLALGRLAGGPLPDGAFVPAGADGEGGEP
jgi:DNA-directed RNA polymerase subunit RPC12/RpoP